MAKRGITSRWLHTPLPFVAAALASVASLVACYMFFVHTTTGQYIDESAWSQAAAFHQRLGTPITSFLDALPVGSLVVGGLTVLLISAVRRRWLAALVAVVSMVGADVTTQVIKALLPERPDRGILTLDFNSLPSGHSTLAASAATAVFLVASPRWRPLIAFLGGSFSIVAGGSTLVNQWHRPADIVAAFLVVAAWGSAAGWFMVHGKDARNAWRGYGSFWAASRFWPALCTALGVLSALGSLIVVWPLSGHATEPTTQYFWAGLALVVIVGYLLSVGATVLFGATTRRGADGSHASRTRALHSV
ncbi:phosphatase PAP2 family protein [Psychromicrobium xiongbiense]|uniref:phosphatase PAP2 family protein n=1 Tax=Psychromicrobium xiongbiense TaxID=3051184 RepID=UPI002553EF51|nr:phosphatase PAP2 family protein [Psychromicrobium sp. YIM S02556]